ncbi:hypothetical protein M758_1G009200 [Ceratodon purpureus]|uniref:Uncharacterized protein n=1 Tax=Ceratodon purpureus TaxID=3225 RepID=A0A8T0J237_CERPU|nr:hypothetical protein KC19_1G010500 [Ceratodon purpureus]KAG0628209.1 hypothetical protein M758_1G009200 [Ceratodon purpureus]
MPRNGSRALCNKQHCRSWEAAVLLPSMRMVNLTVAYFSGYCSSVVCHSVSFHSRLLKYLNRIVSEEHSTTSFEVISALPLPWQNQFYQVRSISKLVQENSKYFRQYFKYGSLQYLS